MNKTIIININGTVFHIEEDAYEILKSYMTDVKRHFMNSADSLEITTDIENRIAEMFSEILTRDNKQALLEQDVKSVVEQMGTVEDFENAEADGKEAGSAAYQYNNNTSRKLFRDTDDHLVAGVCSGIANYFDFEPVWVRLAFAILVGFFGTGFIVYLILWLVVPKATTRADRMAMKGEKLNLQGFAKNFEEEMSTVQNNLRDFKKEAKPFIYKSRDFVGDFASYLGLFIRGAGRVIVRVLSIALLLGTFGMLIVLIVTVSAFLIYGDPGIYHIFPFNIVNYQINTVFLICAFLMLAIPLLTVMLLIISAVFKSESFNRSTGLAFLAVWIISLCTVIYYSAKTVAEFRVPASFRKTLAITPSSTGTYYLKLNDIKYLTGQDSVRLQVKDRFAGMIILDDNDDNDLDGPGRRVSITIEKSDVAVPSLIESFSARGSYYEDALTNARNTTYQFVQQDSVLKFARNLEKPVNKLWRNQELHLTLRVPLNTKLVIDDQLDGFLDGVSVYDCKQTNKEEDASSAAFIMTSDGLQCKVDTLIIPRVKTEVVKKDSLIKDSDIIKKP